MTTDRIEKTLVLKASKSRVWRALSDPTEFGSWFGVKLDSAFEPGARVRGEITVPGYEHVTMEVVVEEVEPERLLSYRWHPAAVEPGVDYSKEPMTLVEFHLEEVADGTRLTVIESGFDKIPATRRADAYRMNEGGWAQQIQNIQRHVSG